MAANDYYTTHPQYPSGQPHQQQHNFPADFRATNTSYEPYRLSASSPHHPPYPFSLSSSNLSTSPSNPSNLSTSSDSASSITNRGFLHPTSNNGPVLKKSKSERAIKFVEKQVKKQIDKKLNGHGHGGGGGHGYGQQIEDYLNQAMQQDSSGAAGAGYGYGDSAQGHGFDSGGFGGSGGGDASGGGF